MGPSDDPSARKDRDTLRRLLALVAADRGALLRATFHQSMQSLTFIPFTAGVTWFVDHVIRPPHPHTPRASATLIAAYAIANILMWGVHGAFTVAAFSASQRIVRATTARLRTLVVDQLQRLSLSYFTRRGVGALANQLTVDMGRVEGFLGNVTGGLVPGVVLGLATMVYLLVLNPLLAAITLLMVPAQAVVIRAASGRLDRLHARVQRSGESFASGITELVTGMRHVRSLGNEELETAKLARAIEDMRESGLAAGVATTWTSLWLQMAHQYVPVLVWCVGGWLSLQGKVSLGELVGFVGLLGFVQAGVGALGGAYQEWVAARPGLASLLAVLDSDEIETFAEPTPGERLRGEVRFEGVTFRYPESERVVLDGLSLAIGAGERIGIVGESGAGKSTLLDLLAAFHLPDAGRVLFDDVDVASRGRRAVRRQCAIMSQEVFLWNATVRENIRLGRSSASDADVEDAARKAGAATFISRLENGFETMCGERGAQLSGGERQRIAMARLFLRDPSLVILDEPTSALDAETASQIQPALEALCEGRTVVIVSHRLGLLRNVDRIVVLRDGKVIESGAPTVLLDDPASHFARLVAASAGESWVR